MLFLVTESGALTWQARWHAIVFALLPRFGRISRLRRPSAACCLSPNGQSPLVLFFKPFFTKPRMWACFIFQTGIDLENSAYRAKRSFLWHFPRVNRTESVTSTIRTITEKDRLKLQENKKFESIYTEVCVECALSKKINPAWTSIGDVAVSYSKQ